MIGGWTSGVSTGSDYFPLDLFVVIILMQSISDCNPDCSNRGRIDEFTKLIDEQSSGKSRSPQWLKFLPINKYRWRSFQPEGHSIIVFNPVKTHLCLDLFNDQCKVDVFSQIFL